MPEQGVQYTDEQARKDFIAAFCNVASFQGRFAYCLMSIYAVNPPFLEYFININWYPFLLWNMIYGITVEIMSRPCLKPLMPIHKFTFSLLGSLSFNYSSLLCFHWIFKHLEDSPVIRTFLGYLAGRILMVHLLAFLYHIDTRCTDPGERPRRISAFEVMYS